MDASTLTVGEISALQYLDKNGTLDNWLPNYGDSFHLYSPLMEKGLIYQQEGGPRKWILTPAAIDLLQPYPKEMEARIKDFIAWLRDKEMEIVRCADYYSEDQHYTYLHKNDDELIADYREQTAQ